MPKSLTALLDKAGDLNVVIAAVSIALLCFAFLFISTRGLLNKLNINTLFRLPFSAVLGIIFILLAVASVAGSQPFVCQSCHPMESAAKNWRLSEHKNVGCLACHKKSKILARPIQNLEQLRMMINNSTGNYQLPVDATVGNRACLDCHGDIAHGVITKFNIMMSHVEVIEADIACADCHGNVAHKKGGRPSISIMEKCSGCHNGGQASARCQTCHIGNVWLGMKPGEGWGITHDKDWPKVHGSRSLYICSSCHVEGDCNRCHSTVPHAEGWSYIHGQEAIKNRNDCNICHESEGFCRGCHRVSMPHSGSWLAVHKVEVEVVGERVCKTCHVMKDCQNCHDKHVQDVTKMTRDGR